MILNVGTEYQKQVLYKALVREINKLEREISKVRFKVATDSYRGKKLELVQLLRQIR